MGRAAVIALLAVAATVVLRFQVTGPLDLEDLAARQEESGVSFGPETPWFASGMNLDGYAFAVISADPFGNGPGKTLIDPAYRYSRFGYSWLAAGLVLGSDELLLAGLSLIGLAAVAITVFVAVRLRDRRDMWAWALVFNPALYFGAVGDTSEAIAIALVTLGIWTGSRVLGGLLGLVRPSYLPALGNRLVPLLIGAATALASRLYWSAHFGDSFFSGGDNLGLPFLGIIRNPSVVGWLVVSAAMVTIGIGLMQRDWGWVLAGLLVVSFGDLVLQSPYATIRASGFLPVLWAFGPRFHPKPLTALFRSEHTVPSTS